MLRQQRVIASAVILGGQPECHGLDEIFDAVLSTGLRLTAFVEHDVSCWRRFPGITDLGDGWPDGAARLPLMFSVRAAKT